MGFIAGVLVALVTGVVSGGYASLVVTRMARFEELRNETRRIIWGIDYVYIGGEPPQVTAHRSMRELLYISSELYALKHGDAGDTVSRLLQEIDNTRLTPPASVDAMNERYSRWQRTCRDLMPANAVIFNPIPKL